MKWLLAIGQTGLTLTDLGARVYTPAGALEPDTSALALVEDGTEPGNYTLTLTATRPTSGRWWVTLAWPPGFGTSYSWPETNAADRVVVPMRQTGIAASIDPTHWLDLVPSGAALTVQEVPGDAGDYLVSGWSSSYGQHEVTFIIAGRSFPGFRWLDAAAGDGEGIAAVEFSVEVGYVITNWRRSALATFDQGFNLPDPGHGFDEISPVSAVGIPFDPDISGDVAPFAPQDLRDVDGQDGVGFLNIDLVRRGVPVVVTPGDRPETEEEHDLQVTIVTPDRRGPALAMAYASALAQIVRFAYFEPGEAGISYIQNLVPPPERPTPDGDDGTWRYDLWTATFSRFYRAWAAGTAA